MGVRVRLVLEYDGTAFAGWQVQPGQRTVQGVLEAALAKMLESPSRVRVDAAGRTDAGVHARAQVAAFTTDRRLPRSAWLEGLSAILPADLSVVDADEVPDDFDPRRAATGKRYVYRIWNGALRSPLRARRHWWVRRPLDAEAMRRAAAAFLGEHDFKSFQAAGCAAKTTVRTLSRFEVTGEAGGEIEIAVEGTAFLRFMVRNLAGTLVEVGLGRLSADAVPGILDARDRDAAGPTAPPEGLTLDAVYYGRRDGR